MAQRVSVTGALLLFLAACSLSAPSRASAGDMNFTLRQALEFAQRNNGDLKALREEKGIRDAGIIKAGTLPNPGLDLEITTGELSGSRSENRLFVGISQEFLTMGKRDKRLRVAEKDLEGFDRQLDNGRRLLSEEVKTTFYSVLLAEKKVELAERSLSLNKQLLEVTRERLEAGDIPELEMNLARVEVAMGEEKKAEAERELDPARSRLLALMGLPPGHSATFSGSLEGKTFAGTLEELKKQALAQRPDIRALESEKAKGEAEVALARAESIPNVTAAVGYEHESTAVEVGGAEATNRDNLIGIRISMPLPLFDRNQAGVHEARARRSSAESRYSYARQNAEREVEAGFARLKSAENSLAIYARDILPQLEENLKLVQEAYRLGEVGILAVIEEQKKFHEVNNAHLSALYTRQAALVKLEALVGADLDMEMSGGKR